MPKRKATRYTFLSVALTTCFLAALLIAKTGSVSREKTKPSASPPSTPATTEVSKVPADTALAREIDKTIDESDLAQARWGVFVTSMSDGRVLYSRNGDKLFTPASNMKIYTTAAGLDLLGEDYRWRTSVYAEKQPDSNGMIDGDLTLYGRGDPGLDSSGKD